MTDLKGNNEVCFDETLSVQIILPLKNRTNYELQYLLYVGWHTRICRGFIKVHGLIRCKSKIQVVVSSGEFASFFRPIFDP